MARRDEAGPESPVPTAPGYVVCCYLCVLLVVQVVLEPAAPVGTTQPAGEVAEQQLFPHLYGGIDLGAVTAELGVTRSQDGTFLSIAGL